MQNCCQYGEIEHALTQASCESIRGRDSIFGNLAKTSPLTGIWWWNMDCTMPNALPSVYRQDKKGLCHFYTSSEADIVLVIMPMLINLIGNELKYRPLMLWHRCIESFLT